MEVRAVKASELDETVDLQRLVYRPDDPGAVERYGTYMKEDPTYTLGHTRVVFDWGRLVAHLRIWDRTLRIRGADVRAGGIGSLLVHPEFRGRGYAQALMRDTEQYFSEAGYDIGLLFTIIGTPFYEAQGWTPILLPTFEMDVADGTPGPDDPAVRMLDPARDLSAVEVIYARVGLGYCGVAVRPSNYWLCGPSRIRGVFPRLGVERDGQLVAYVTHDEDGGYVWISEACALPGEEWAFDGLARALFGRNPTKIEGSLPRSHAFIRALESVDGQATIWGTDDHMMVKLANWQALAGKLGGNGPAIRPEDERAFWRALYGVDDPPAGELGAWIQGLPPGGEAFFWSTDGF